MSLYILIPVLVRPACVINPLISLLLASTEFVPMLLMPYLPIFASWWVTAWRSRAFVLPEFFVFAAAAPSAAGPPEISLAAFAFSPVVRPAPPVVAASSSPNSLVCAGYFWCRRLLLICCRCFRCSTPLPPTQSVRLSVPLRASVLLCMHVPGPVLRDYPLCQT